MKKGDNVIVIAGKEKGAKGVITEVFPTRGKVLIAGVNKVKKHQKPKSRGEKGSIIEIEAPITASNVMLVDPKTGTRTRVAKKKVGESYVRIAKKSGQELK